MADGGDEKVRVHMNVEPRSTGTQIVQQRINSEVIATRLKLLTKSNETQRSQKG